MVLVFLGFLWISLSAFPQHLPEFRWQRASGSCLDSKGNSGLNESFIGECGNLKDQDLSGKNLKDTNFRGAKLQGVNFAKANMRGTDLRGADLRDANLFQYADFTDAIYSDESKFSVESETLKAMGLIYFSWEKLDDALSSACWSLNTEQIEKYLKLLANPSVNDSSCLKYTLKADLEDTVRLLISFGAELNPVEAEPVLHFLTDKINNIDLLKKYVPLLTKAGADPNHLNFYGRPAWQFPLSMNKVALVKLLFENGASVEAKNSSGRPPLWYARSLEVFELLFNLGADPHFRTNVGWDVLFVGYLQRCSGEGPTISCVKEDIPAVIELFRQKGFDFNYRHEDETTDLMRYMVDRFFEPEFLPMLFRAGANINAIGPEDLNLLFWFASRSKRKSAWQPWEEYWDKFTKGVHILLDHGIDLSSTNPHNETVTMYLMRYHHHLFNAEPRLKLFYDLGVPKDVWSKNSEELGHWARLNDSFYMTLASRKRYSRKFLNGYYSGSQLNLVNHHNQTLLMYAVASSWNAFYSLLRMGAELSPVDDFGYNAQFYHFFCINRMDECPTPYTGHLRIEDVISDINYQDPKDGQTLLHKYVIISRQETVRKLLKNGADKEIKDFSGKLAIDYAKENGDKTLIYMLEKD